MDKLILANEGVFPITRDAKGERLTDKPATLLPVSGTIQGEGKLAGVPSLFIRLSGCNLRCIWEMPDGSFSRCDTPYASFSPDSRHQLSVSEIMALVKANLGPLKHVVITGGEPLLQKKALASLLQQLKAENLHITIETNGTLFDEEAASYVDLFSISPKLANSTPDAVKLKAYNLNPSGPLTYHGEKRKNLKTLQSYIDLCNQSGKELQIKFVIGKYSDADEINYEFLNHLQDLNQQDILLMPLGADVIELEKTTPMVLEMAITNGWRFAPRIHINVFGPMAGV